MSRSDMGLTMRQTRREAARGLTPTAEAADYFAADETLRRLAFGWAVTVRTDGGLWTVKRIDGDRYTLRDADGLVYVRGLDGAMEMMWPA